MRSFRHFVITLLLALGITPSLHADDIEIFWGVNNAPPFHIAEGYFSNQGYVTS